MSSSPATPHPVHTAEMGLGTWQWGDQLVWGYGQGYDARDLQDSFERSLQAGVTFMDTAEVYGLGQSERYLGRFLRASGQPVVVATKFMPLPWRLGKGAFRNALRGSLQRLGLNQVDLYQMHWPNPPVAIETWMTAMADAMEAGLVRAAGVSNYNTAQTTRAHAALQKRGLALASNQVPYSLLDRRYERNGLLTLCRQLGIRVIAYSPLAQGLLTGKYTPQTPPPGFRGQRWKAALSRVAPLVEALRALGEAHGGKTPAQVALNWCICKGTLPIPGAKSARQAEQNAGALGWRLTAAEVAQLDALSDQAA